MGILLGRLRCIWYQHVQQLCAQRSGMRLLHWTTRSFLGILHMLPIGMFRLYCISAWGFLA